MTLAGSGAAVQDLDDRLAAEQRLLGAVDGAEAALADLLADDEVAQSSGPTSTSPFHYTSRMLATIGCERSRTTTSTSWWRNGEAAVVDPGDAAPAEAAAERLGVRSWPPADLVHAPSLGPHQRGGRAGGAARCRGLRRRGGRGAHRRGDAAAGRRERFDFAGHTVETLAIPAHTLGQVAFLVEGNVFPGDTLFGGGCGGCSRARRR